MGRGGQDFRRDEGHALNLDEAFGQYRTAIAHQDFIVFLVLLFLFPHVHPLSEFFGAEQVVIDFIRADPLRDRAAVDVFDLILDLVFLKDLFAGLNRQLAVPIVDTQHHTLALFEVPARIQAMVIGPLCDMLQIG